MDIGYRLWVIDGLSKQLESIYTRSVNKNSTAFSKVSIGSVRLQQMCLQIQLMKEKNV